MLKELPAVKKGKEEKRAKLLVGMKQDESSAGIDLEDVKVSSTHALPKTSTHSTNLSSGENTTTIPALLLAGGGS